MMKSKYLFDNGGRRSNIDRRNYDYSIYSPDNRNMKRRMNGLDRRKTQRFAKDTVVISNVNGGLEEFAWKLLNCPNKIDNSSPKVKGIHGSSIDSKTNKTKFEYQTNVSHGPPRSWHFIDPLDEIHFSEVLKNDYGEDAYIIYCVDTLNAYRLTGIQRSKYESFTNSELKAYRIEMYSNNNLIQQFEQV